MIKIKNDPFIEIIVKPKILNENQKIGFKMLITNIRWISGLCVLHVVLYNRISLYFH